MNPVALAPELTGDARGRNLMKRLSSAEAALSDEDTLRLTSVRMNRKKYHRPYKEQRGDINVVVRKGSWKGILNLEPGNFVDRPRQLSVGQLNSPGKRWGLGLTRCDLQRLSGRGAHGHAGTVAGWIDFVRTEQTLVVMLSPPNLNFTGQCLRDEF